MTLNGGNLVQGTLVRLAPTAEVAAELFYGPEFRSMFRGDMKEQGRELMQMLTVAPKGLDRLREIPPAVREMGPPPRGVRRKG